jgi:hypothetical protein
MTKIEKYRLIRYSVFSIRADGSRDRGFGHRAIRCGLLRVHFP